MPITLTPIVYAIEGSDLTIESRGPGAWVVRTQYGDVLGVDGAWDWEPMPSSRTPEFISRTRHTLERAQELALAEIERTHA